MTKPRRLIPGWHLQDDGSYTRFDWRKGWRDRMLTEGGTVASEADIPGHTPWGFEDAETVLVVCDALVLGEVTDGD